MSKYLFKIKHFKAALLAAIFCLVSLSSACQQSLSSELPDLTEPNVNDTKVLFTDAVVSPWYNFKDLINQPNFSVVKLGKTEHRSLNYDDAFLTEISTSERTTVLYCVTTWSETAYNYLPVIIDLHRIYGEKVDFYVINTDECASLAEKYKLKIVPTLLLLHKKELIWRKTEHWQDLSPDLTAELKTALAYENE